VVKDRRGVSAWRFLEDNISTAIKRVLARQFEAAMKEQNYGSEVSSES
jgi:hypothetical protein